MVNRMDSNDHIPHLSSENYTKLFDCKPYGSATIACIQVSIDRWIVNQSMSLLVERLCFTACTISMGAAIAPMPLSPHANVFFTGSMTVPPSCCNTARCVAVKGLSHMKVFMAGATCEVYQSGGTMFHHSRH